MSRHRTVPLPLVGDDLTAAVPAPEQVAEERETSRLLRDAVVALPPHQREVVVCRYLLDFSERETAQVLGIATGTVKSRLSRALAALQATLRPTMAPAAMDAEGRRG
jgi:RNA polymerase sigma-70 factor (ECF subfamily)